MPNLMVNFNLAELPDNALGSWILAELDGPQEDFFDAEIDRILIDEQIRRQDKRTIPTSASFEVAYESGALSDICKEYSALAAKLSDVESLEGGDEAMAEHPVSCYAVATLAKAIAEAAMVEIRRGNE